MNTWAAYKTGGHANQLIHVCVGFVPELFLKNRKCPYIMFYTPILEHTPVNTRTGFFGDAGVCFRVSGARWSLVTG